MMKEKIKDGIILVDKPKGISSFDVIRRLRKEYVIAGEKAPKMGHAGTLDPMATGLLIIGVGKDTKKLHELLGLDKVYEAEITLGIATGSFDMDGKIIKKMEIPNLTKERIIQALESFIGEKELDVPIFSALKREGKPLYEYAREGKTIEIPKRKMKIIKAEFRGFDGIRILVRFEVGSGTYIRSIANEIGPILDTVSVLSGLRRISIGEYRIEDARII